jgi:hypothetical protein
LDNAYHGKGDIGTKDADTPEMPSEALGTETWERSATKSSADWYTMAGDGTTDFTERRSVTRALYEFDVCKVFAVWCGLFVFQRAAAVRWIPEDIACLLHILKRHRRF